MYVILKISGIMMRNELSCAEALICMKVSFGSAKCKLYGVIMTEFAHQPILLISTW